MIQIELKGFYQTNQNSFTAIAPVWLYEHSRDQGEYPCNHYLFTGKVAGIYEDISYAQWNPENIFFGRGVARS